MYTYLSQMKIDIICHNMPKPDQSILSAPAFDPKWEHSNLTHYSHLSSNERGAYFFKESLAPFDPLKPSGLYVGLGSDINYNLISHANAEYAVLFDYDPAVVATHLIHRAAFINSESIKEFIDFYDDTSVERSVGIIRNTYQDQPQIQDILTKMMQNPYTRSLFHTRFRMMEAQYEGKTSRYMDTFLNDESKFGHIRQMYLEDRIIISMGNLFDPDFIASIGELTRSLDTEIVGFYASNAPDYRPDDFQKIRGVLQNLPARARSKLLLASHVFAAMRGGGDWTMVGQDSWAYMTTPLGK